MKEELVGNTITYHSINIDEEQKVHAQVTIETANAVKDYTFEAETLSGLYGLIVVEMTKQDELLGGNTHE